MKASKSILYATLTLCVISIIVLSCNPSKESNSLDLWSTLEPLPLDPTIEAQIDEMLPKLTLEQKVGQVIQADSGSVILVLLQELQTHYLPELLALPFVLK